MTCPNCVVCHSDMELGENWLVLCPDHTNQMMHDTEYNLDDFEPWIRAARKRAQDIRDGEF